VAHIAQNEMRNVYTIFGGNLKGRDYFGGLGVEG
jgi:hypothetical protein